MPWIYRMALYIFLLALPAAIYIGFRLSSAIAQVSRNSRYCISKKAARLMVFAVITWVYLWPGILIHYRLSGNFKDLFVTTSRVQWQDYLFQFPAWWGLICIVNIFPYFLALDIFGIVSRVRFYSRANAGEKPPDRLWPSRLKIAVTVFFLFYVGVRTYLDTNHLRVTEGEVAIKNLPEQLNGLQIAFFGDMHMNRYTQEDELELLKKTLQSGEDHLVVFTGDLNSRGRSFLNRAYEIVKNPRGKLGNFACMGDHDYWTAPQEVPREMEQRGWTFLHNRHQLMEYQGHRILVTGITHVYSHRISKPELETLLGSAPEAELKILAVHQPMEFLVETAAKYGYHLFLGGHTHGGEVVNHVFGIPYSPGQKETRYCWGQHIFKDLHIVVTNGIGRTLAPLRYHAPSEITRLTLVKK